MMYHYYNNDTLDPEKIQTEKGSNEPLFILTQTHRIIIIDRFYIALFYAREQTHCARMWFYMSQ